MLTILDNRTKDMVNEMSSQKLIVIVNDETENKETRPCAFCKKMKDFTLKSTFYEVRYLPYLTMRCQNRDNR